LIGAFEVFAEAIEDAACGGCVEEAEGGACEAVEEAFEEGETWGV